MEKVNLRVKTRKASPKMKKFGILGTATVEFLNKDKTIPLVRIDGITVRRSKKKGQRPWLAMPQVEYQDQAGDTKYKTVVKIAPEEEIGQEGGFKEYFDGIVLAALKKTLSEPDEEPERKPQKQSGGWGDDDEPKSSGGGGDDWGDDSSDGGSSDSDEDIW